MENELQKDEHVTIQLEFLSVPLQYRERRYTSGRSSRSLSRRGTYKTPNPMFGSCVHRHGNWAAEQLKRFGIFCTYPIQLEPEMTSYGTTWADFICEEFTVPRTFLIDVAAQYPEILTANFWCGFQLFARERERDRHSDCERIFDVNILCVLKGCTQHELYMPSPPCAELAFKLYSPDMLLPVWRALDVSERAGYASRVDVALRTAFASVSIDLPVGCEVPIDFTSAECAVATIGSRARMCRPKKVANVVLPSPVEDRFWDARLGKYFGPGCPYAYA